MEATARVVAVSDGRARLACEDEAACGACGSGRGCAIRWFAGSRRTLEVPDLTDDHQPLRPGQRVTIEAGEGEVLRAAAVVYLPPLAGLLVGAVLGRWITAGDERGAMALAALGGVAGWWIARRLSRRSPPRMRVRQATGGAG
jgi:sigma-E factor negative regulatory protein RseC